MDILLLAPSFLNLYQDVISELERQGHFVEFIKDRSFEYAPCLIRNKRQSPMKEKIYGKILKSYWKKKCPTIQTSKIDILLVINGKSYHPYLKEYIKQKNPRLKVVLYLWDKTYQNYRFDKYFDSFDDVITFDRVDAEKLNIRFLPCYWVPQFPTTNPTYDIFGFGTIRKDRYELFKSIWLSAQKLNLTSFVKLYQAPLSQSSYSKIKRSIKTLFKEKPETYIADLITNKPLPPADFRSLISNSRCVIDTYNTFQEGLTPRFMWALGAGCKIITTNKNCRDYAFYSPDYIYITDSTKPQIPKDFLLQEYRQPQNRIDIINQYRIDNWLKQILRNV